MEYERWLDYQRTLEPLSHCWDDELQATVTLGPMHAYGIQIVEVLGHGFLVLDAVLCRKRYPRLYDPQYRYYDGARPLAVRFIEPSTVYAPYIPVLTKK